MVGLFVRLKLRLLAGALRTPARRVGIALGAAFGLAAAALLGAALFYLRDDRVTAAALAIVLATAIAIGWAVLPIAAFGNDETLDVARLALLPLRRGTLLAGLLAASLVGVAPLLTALLLALGVAAVTTSAGAVPVALVAYALLVPMCLGLGRLVTAALSRLLRSRRGRDLAVVVGLLIVLAAQAPRLLLENVGEEGLDRVGGLLRWTPPGAAVGAVADASAGRWIPALLGLLAAAVFVALVLWGWYVALGAALVVVDASTEQRGRRRPGLLALLPDTRLGAVAGKEIRYAWRDPRLKFSWLQMLVFGAGVPAFTLLHQDRFGALVAGTFSALLVTALGFNLFGPEGSAFWITAAATGSARDARTDLAGRNLAVALIALPWVAVAATVFAAIALPVERVPLTVLMTLGAAAAVLGAGCAAGAVISVLAPYPMPDQPGAAFAGPGPGRGCLAGLLWMAGATATAIAALPVVLPALLAGDRPLVALAVAVTGPLWGFLLARGGRHLAAGHLVTHLPETLVAVSPDRV